jgi:hypothetical protein
MLAPALSLTMRAGAIVLIGAMGCSIAITRWRFLRG